MGARFVERVALVAGGTGALGRAVSLAFLQEGASVVVTYRRQEEFDGLHRAAGTKASYLTGRSVDVTNEAEIGQLVADMVAKHGRLDSMINAVGGYAAGRSLWETEPSVLSQMLSLNLLSGYVLCRAVVPAMLKLGGGAIVNVASRAAIDHVGAAGAYAASKAAAVAMIDSLAADLKGTGVRANSILPSIIDTEANRREMPSADYSNWPKPEDIARVILFLCSEEAKLIHGAAISVLGKTRQRLIEGQANPILSARMNRKCLLNVRVLPRALSAQVLTVLMWGWGIGSCWAQADSQKVGQNIKIEVLADRADGSIAPIWNYFGYDEPNYTYSANGKKLLGELAALSAAPAYVRVHNLLTSGDGSASLKWGSTNVYTEDAAGKPVYSWVILDNIFDTFRAAGVKPLVEIGFMPEALSTHPQPYRHNFPQGSIFTGWAYPPKDYQKWAELVFQLVRHLRERYGDAEVKTWLWEIWNEPDIGYWQGTREEFFKLYDYSADAIWRALPDARIGGPDSTGPANPKAAEFLRAFLQHCAHQQNYATGGKESGETSSLLRGKVGAQLDFIAFHPKGSPTWQGDHVVMGISRQLASIEQGLKIVKSFPEWRETPVVLGESDPEGCAACSARTNPQNVYRNGALYAAYTTEALNATSALAAREGIRLVGSVSWSFEFEGQPYFEGFRELATNGIDKPVLNAFRMFGLLGNERIKVASTGTIPIEQVVNSGVRQPPDITAIATRKSQEVDVMVWNYHDEDVEVPATPIDLTIKGLPSPLGHGLVEHYRIDRQHSNAFTAWKEMGSPQSPSAEQYDQLQRSGQLQLLTSPAWTPVERGEMHLHFTLPRQGLSLLRVSW